MSWKLKIGSYIIDAADTGSTSTTTGAVLGWDPETAFKPTVSATQFNWPEFWIYLTAPDAATLKTRIEEVANALNTVDGQTVILEEDGGTTVLEMKSTDWPQVTGSMDIDIGDTTAKIIVTNITGTRPGGVSGGGADEPGQIGAITWQYEITSGGLAGLTASATFGPTTSPSKGARENAEAWRFKLLDKNNFPSFVGDSFRQVDALFNLDVTPEQATITEASYNPCTCTLIMRERPKGVTLPDEILSCDAKATVVPRKPLNTDSGHLHGYDVVFAGSLTIKIQGNTAWESAETSVTQAETYTKLLDAANSLNTDFLARYTKFLFTQLGEPTIDIDTVNGVCSFSFKYTTADRILQWDEVIVVRNQARKIYDDLTDGQTFVHEQAGGDLRTLQHSLSTQVIGSPQPFKPLKLPKQWDQLDATQNHDVGVEFDSGVIVYSTNATRSYRWVQDSPSAGGAGIRSGGGSFNKQTVGDGIL